MRAMNNIGWHRDAGNPQPAAVPPVVLNPSLVSLYREQSNQSAVQKNNSSTAAAQEEPPPRRSCGAPPIHRCDAGDHGR